MGKLGPIRHTIPIVPESGTKVADFRANSNHAAKMTRNDGKAGAHVRLLLDPGYSFLTIFNISADAPLHF